jgi:co-chaperonin GroES (HSP10)
VNLIPDLNTVKIVGNRALIRRDPTGGRVGLILLPETKNTDEKACTVLAVGPGKWLPKLGKYEPPEVQVGDRVVVLQYEGEKLGQQLDGGELEIIDCSLIEAILPKDAKNV